MYTSGKYWEGIPDYLAEQAPRKIAWLLRLIDFDNLLKRLPQKRLSIVDIGCGAGKVSVGLAQALRERHPDLAISVQGYDLSPLAIEVAKRENQEGEFVCGDFQDAGRTWDLALLCDIIEHVENPDAFLRAVAQRSRYFAVGFAMDDNLAYRLSKRRREIANKGSHVSLFDEARALAVGVKHGNILAHGYIPNPMTRNFHIRSFRNVVTLPMRVVLQLLSRRLKGRLFGGESLYLFCESRLFPK